MHNEASSAAQARNYFTRLDWRPLDREDSEALRREVDAPFILRSWRETDDEFGHQWAGVCEGMATITIVFKAGCRLVRQYTRSFGDPLLRAGWEAEDILEQRSNFAEIVS